MLMVICGRSRWDSKREVASGNQLASPRNGNERVLALCASQSASHSHTHPAPPSASVPHHSPQL